MSIGKYSYNFHLQNIDCLSQSLFFALLQGNNHQNAFSEKKSRANWPSKCRPNESDSLTSPRSISNSSLHEVDQELSGEELTTFLYQVNCNLNGRS